jgi:GT2 family glycosyltransferase
VNELSISIVVYHSEMAQLSATLQSLRLALETAKEAGAIGSVTLSLVDNGSADEQLLDAAARATVEGLPWLRLKILRGQGNVGYGRGHNLPIMDSEASYHLILNPDVILAPDAILESARFLDANQDVGLLAPRGYDATGARQYLCRLYPTLLALYLRGFAPAFLRQRFQSYLHAHEMRGLTEEQGVKGIPVVHGCYMFTRLSVLQAIGGFSPRYFMYFEDSDLSLRLGRAASLAFVPQVNIVHFGGGAARKGFHHIVLFVRSAFTFFQTHGWRMV